MPIQTGSMLGKHYEIVSRIGVGSFGVVYKAKRLSDGKVVAVKEIRVECLSNNAPSVKGELTIFPHLSHPHIATYYLQTYDDITNCYLVEMECYNRGNLRSYIREYRRAKIDIPEEEVWRICSEILTALDYLHSENKPDGIKGVIIHRDIKPENILLTHDNQVKLCDFGASRFLKPAAMADSIVGSPLFMAPEVAFNKGYREPVDMWSLGCVVMNMCTRIAPQILGNKPYNQLQDVVPNIPDIYSDDLRGFIASCLRISPAHRLTVRQALKYPRITAHLHKDSLILSFNIKITPDGSPGATGNQGNQGSCLSQIEFDKNLSSRGDERSYPKTPSRPDRFNLSMVQSDIEHSETQRPSIDVKSNTITAFSNSVVALPIEIATQRSQTVFHPPRSGRSCTSTTSTTPRLTRQGSFTQVDKVSVKLVTSDEYNLYAVTLKDGTTGLMLAAEANDICIVNELLLSQARTQDRRGKTALIRATERGNLEAVAILAPLESRQTDTDARTALMYAAKTKQLLCAELLMHAEGRCRKRNGWTALMTATEAGAIEVVQLLKQKEADIAMLDGTTPLMVAAKVGNIHCLQEFITEDAGKVDDAGFFALLWAILCNNVPCIAPLLPYELQLRDKHGKSAYYWAKEKRRRECMLLIEEYCARERVNLP